MLDETREKQRSQQQQACWQRRVSRLHGAAPTPSSFGETMPIRPFSAMELEDAEKVLALVIVIAADENTRIDCGMSSLWAHPDPAKARTMRRAHPFRRRC